MIEREDSGEEADVYRLTSRLKVKGSLNDEQVAQLRAVVSKYPARKLMTTATAGITTGLGRMS